MSEDEHQHPVSFSRARTWLTAWNVLISTLAVLAIAVMANYASARWRARFDLTGAESRRISAVTGRVLDTLTNDVSVTVFFNPKENLFGSVSSLLKSYRQRSPRIKLEFVDYRQPGRAEAVRAKYAMSSAGDASHVIFDCRGRVKIVMATELSEYGMGETNEVRRTGFKGEQLFTSSILSVSQERQLRAYFLVGRGELDPNGQESQRGLSQLVRVLADNNVESRILPPLVGVRLPEDCSLLVIVGASEAFAPEELEQIEKYLSSGGRLLCFFNRHVANGVSSGLERVLTGWGVDVGFNQVVDERMARTGDKRQILTGRFAPHAVMRPLFGKSLNFIVPRSVAARTNMPSRADAPKVTELVHTSDMGMVLSRFDQRGNAAIESRGSIPLLVSVEKGVVQGVSGDKGATRMIIGGDTLFLANGTIDLAANRAFATIAVNWLTSQDVMASGLTPQPIKDYLLHINESQMESLEWTLLAVIPGGVLFLGFLVWLRRRA